MWTAANISVASGATLAVNVGGPNDFTTDQVNTLFTSLTTSIASNGLQAGSSFGLDTTNASSAVTYSNNITDSTGTGGGSITFAKLGTGTLILSGEHLQWRHCDRRRPAGIRHEDPFPPDARGWRHDQRRRRPAVAGPYTTVMGWLGSGKIATSSAGALALVGTSGGNHFHGQLCQPQPGAPWAPPPTAAL